MSIFEKASRQKLRFPSTKGELTTEQLWDLPLTSKTGFDLDSVAKAVHSDLSQASLESFVATKANPAKAALELKLEVVKYVIAIKLAEHEAAQQAQQNGAERQRLLEALHRKENAELMELTPAQIRERLEKLGG